MDDALLPTYEHCPDCGAGLEPEAEQCGACGCKLFDIGPEQSRGAVFRQGEDTVGDPFDLLDDEGSYAERPPAEFQNLVPVATGDVHELMALRASLGARGFDTFLNDDQTKVIDPFITGGYVFGSTLMAPPESAEEIRRFVATVRAEPAGVTPDGDPLLAKLKRHERNLMLSTLLFQPAGAVIGFYYLGVLRKLDGRPRGWAWGLALWGICLLVTAGYVVFVVALIWVALVVKTGGF